MVARGHRLDEVVNSYSVRKINALHKAAIDNHNFELKMFGVAVRNGYHASGKEFDLWLKKG